MQWWRRLLGRLDGTAEPFDCAWCTQQQHDQCTGVALRLGMGDIGRGTAEGPCRCAASGHRRTWAASGG